MIYSYIFTFIYLYIERSMTDQISSILNLQDSELANSIQKLNSDPEN